MKDIRVHDEEVIDTKKIKKNFKLLKFFLPKFMSLILPVFNRNLNKTFSYNKNPEFIKKGKKKQSVSFYLNYFLITSNIFLGNKFYKNDSFYLLNYFYRNSLVNIFSKHLNFSFYFGFLNYFNGLIKTIDLSDSKIFFKNYFDFFSSSFSKKNNLIGNLKLKKKKKNIFSNFKYFFSKNYFLKGLDLKNNFFWTLIFLKNKKLSLNIKFFYSENNYNLFWVFYFKKIGRNFYFSLSKRFFFRNNFFKLGKKLRIKDKCYFTISSGFVIAQIESKRRDRDRVSILSDFGSFSALKFKEKIMLLGYSSLGVFFEKFKFRIIFYINTKVNSYFKNFMKNFKKKLFLDFFSNLKLNNIDRDTLENIEYNYLENFYNFFTFLSVSCISHNGLRLSKKRKV